jgi:hypothetical protein
MPTSEELEELNKESLARQRATRDARNSSAGGDERGGIYDVSTDTYSQPDNNQVGINNDIANKGIDIITGSTSIGGGAGGDTAAGFEEETLDVVNDDNTAGQRVFLTQEV